MSNILKTLIFAFVLVFALPISAADGDAFDVQGRSGKPGHADWELGVLYPNTGWPQSQSHYTWQSGALVPWQLDYHNATNTLTWIWDIGSPSQTTLGGYVFSSPFNSVQVWASTSTSKVTANDSVSVVDLVLQSSSGTEFGSDVIAQGPGDYASFVFSTPISGDFTLTGKSALTWDQGAFPDRSRMQFHITDATVAVPEPSTYLIMASFLALALYFRQRRLKQAA